MHVECIALGDFETNCYIIRETEDAKECLIIDPGFSPEPLVELLQQNDWRPQRIILTHGHCDHIAGIKLLRETFDSIPVGISSLDQNMLTNDKENLAWMTGGLLKLDEPENILEPGDIIKIGQLELNVLPTPGHTPGGISFYCEKAAAVFVGDALFSGSIGRTDFPNGDTNALLSGIREQIFTLPEDTVVYTGHGPATTVGIEKNTNPFLN
ncbi:MAG: MBL fold metallo-hydrolase [Planctomycetes bacterium]|nr:MBL fold metallo-hydrolase [Planctomycetota bacterium]